MKLFGHSSFSGNDLNRPLCALADQVIQTGRTELGARDAGSQLKLIAHIDEITYVKEAYVNLVHFLQVHNMTNKLGSGSVENANQVRLACLWTAKKQLQNTLVITVRRLLLHLRDSHNVPVSALLDEIRVYGEEPNFSRSKKQRHAIGVRQYREANRHKQVKI